MDIGPEEITVKRAVRIAASRETVWEFLVDPAKATRWMGQMATMDPRPGGKFRIGVIPNNVASGDFLVVDPPSRLVYTWGWDPDGDRPLPPPGSTVVEFELIPEGSETLLRFTHRKLPSAKTAAGHSRGWDHYLSRLVTAASGGDPGPDPWIYEPPPNQ